MTECDNNIENQLLTNSQISGVVLSGLSTKLSHSGHGLYIKSEGDDTYCDLRLNFEKPFWGHTHPLMIQHKFNNLNLELEKEFSSITKVDFKKKCNEYSLIENFVDDFNDEKLMVSINEKDILNHPNLLEVLKNLSLKNELIIIEKDLINFNLDKLFYFADIKAIHVLDFHFLDTVLIKSDQFQSMEQINSHLYSAMQKYLSYLVFSENGKNHTDYKIIDESISKTSGINRTGRYLSFSLNGDKDTLIKAFLKQGILINQNNIMGCNCYMAIPLSCTNEELSDTLERIHTVLSEL